MLSGESAHQAAERFLAAKRLLVTDNLGHLLAAAPFIGGCSEPVQRSGSLATSREPLELQAEERHPVSPLALPEPGTPEDPQALARTDAVALFCERARAHDPDFRLSTAAGAAVAEICRYLDGLLLALELAAARCGLLSPTEIAERLDHALGEGARDAPARQQTLRRNHRLEPRPARRRREAVLCALRGLRRRRDGRGGRDDHREPRHTRPPYEELLALCNSPQHFEVPVDDGLFVPSGEVKCVLGRSEAAVEQLAGMAAIWNDAGGRALASADFIRAPDGSFWSGPGLMDI